MPLLARRSSRQRCARARRACRLMTLPGIAEPKRCLREYDAKERPMIERGQNHPNYHTDFRAIGHAVRLHSGRDALAALPAELKRQGARRAFIVCGRSVARKTALIERVRGILGTAC